jgi:hypothetical protein
LLVDVGDVEVLLLVNVDLLVDELLEVAL